MSYYPDEIKFYKSATGFITGIKEIMHIIWIKNFFKRTNMRKSYKKQILDNNVEKFSLIKIVDSDMFSFTKILIWANQNVKLQINFLSKAKKIMEDLKQYLKKNERRKLYYSYLSTNYQCLAKTIADKAGVPGFVDALVIFIKLE